MEDGRSEELSPVEREVARALIDESGVGRPLDRRLMQRQRSVESYLRGGVMPRYMQRAAQIERLTQLHADTLRLVRAELEDEHRAGGPALEDAWADALEHWDFDEVNALIEQHNEWYPMERDLPMDPRTGDYVLIQGRTYLREPLDAAWGRRVVLEEE